MKALMFPLAIALAPVTAATAGEPPARLPVSTFFANAKFSSPRLSDDGKTIAVIVSRGDTQIILSGP